MTSPHTFMDQNNGLLSSFDIIDHFSKNCDDQ